MPWNLTDALDELAAGHLLRRLRPIHGPQGPIVGRDGAVLVNFSSNDYLGLANHPRLRAAMHEGVDLYGVGSGASRLVCGSSVAHEALESEIAAFKGTEAALTFSSGFAAAQATITALLGPGDVVILDKLCHASLVDAARQSGATLRVFPHKDLSKLERLVTGLQNQRVLVVAESVYSMDGDVAPLREMVAICDRAGAWLMLDEAHGVGVIGPGGRGLAHDLEVQDGVHIHMGTLSKSMGLSGGYIASRRAVIDTVINRGRSFIYTTAPPPCLAHAASEALRLLSGAEGDAARLRLRDHVKRLAIGLGMAPPPAAIVPIIVGAEGAALAMSQQMLELGYLIPAIRWPTVARGTARLRVTLSASHTTDQVVAVTERLAAVRSDRL
jgi:8-amino-7-oxononanoate synthase